MLLDRVGLTPFVPGATPGGVQPRHRADAPAALPVALRVALAEAWHRSPADRRRLSASVVRCARWARACGAPPERALLLVKRELTVEPLPLVERTRRLAEREAALTATVAAYFGGATARVRAARPEPVRRSRTVRDTCGQEWRVYERTDRCGAPRASARSLVFDRETCVRRRRAYPTDWRARSDAELCRLLDGVDGLDG